MLSGIIRRTQLSKYTTFRVTSHCGEMLKKLPINGIASFMDSPRHQVFSLRDGLPIRSPAFWQRLVMRLMQMLPIFMRTTPSLHQKNTGPNENSIGRSTLMIPRHRNITTRLATGVWVAGSKGRFSGPERQMLDEMGLQSILVVPIQVKGIYWGFIGFSDYTTERVWADTEIEILMTLASTLGLIFGEQIRDCSV